VSDVDRHGYVVLEERLPDEHVAAMADAVERLRRRPRWRRYRSQDGPATFIENPFAGAEPLCELVDWPPVLEQVVDLLGWNVYVYDAVAIVTAPDGVADGPSTTRATSFGWHRDGGRMDKEATGDPPPRLAVKVGVFLSDVSEPGRGNLEVVPGSHLRPAGDSPVDGDAAPAVPICGPPGTVVVFDRRIAHTAGPNRSDLTRRAVMVGYAHRWIRPLQEMTFPRRWRRFDAVRRQLLGERRPTYGRFFPDDEDVPLRRRTADGGRPSLSP